VLAMDHTAFYWRPDV